jgi:AcrR family transcriptional regulator
VLNEYVHTVEEIPRVAGVRETKRVLRVEQILEAALGVLAREGYAAFSVRKVAAAAGVRLNTVQHHFGDHKALVLAMVRSKMTGYVDRYKRLASDTELPVKERLEAVLDDAFLEVSVPEVNAFFFEIWALGRQDDDIAALLRETYKEYCATLAAMAREIQPKLTESEAAVIAAMIGACTEGAAVLSNYGGAGTPPSGAVVARMKAMFLAMIAGKI